MSASQYAVFGEQTLADAYVSPFRLAIWAWATRVDGVTPRVQFRITSHQALMLGLVKGAGVSLGADAQKG